MYINNSKEKLFQKTLLNNFYCMYIFTENNFFVCTYLLKKESFSRIGTLILIGIVLMAR